MLVLNLLFVSFDIHPFQNMHCEICEAVSFLDVDSPVLRELSNLQETCIKCIVANIQCLNELGIFKPILPTSVYNKLFQTGRLHVKLPNEYPHFRCRIAALRNIFSKKDLTFPKDFVAWLQSEDSSRDISNVFDCCSKTISFIHCYFKVPSEKIYFHMCPECMKLYLETTDEVFLKNCRYLERIHYREYFIQINNPKFWCSECKQVPLFYLVPWSKKLFAPIKFFVIHDYVKVECIDMSKTFRHVNVRVANIVLKEKTIEWKYKSLDSLKSELEIFLYRKQILYFELLSKRLNSRLRFIINDKSEFHLNNCVWSRDDAVEGPDTCHCSSALYSPNEFFDNQINCHSSYSKVSDPKNRKTHVYLKDKFLNNKDFYYRRVLDRQSILKWYEMYKNKVNIIQFRIKVRQLGKENEIDAFYNPNSKEWHLTDCIRSVECDKGPDTCFCQKAILDPLKYLKEKYNYVDVQNQITPVNYIMNK